MPRTNGCQCPWKLGQATAFGIWFVVLAGCYALFIPDITDTAVQATVIVVYTLAAIAVTCTYTIVCNINPGTKVNPTAEEETPLYCEHCQGYVSRGSKHCKECQKCIENFDHHCKWVNNCIGSKNYRSFFFLLTSICSMFAVQLGCGIYLIVRCFTEPDTSAAKLAEVYPSSVQLRDYIAALFVYTAFLAIALYPLAELLLLHIVLRIRGMTTWDYIMANRETAIEPSALSRQFASASRKALTKIRSFGPRSSRVHDISTNGGSRSAGATVYRTQKVGINPFLACVTDMDKLKSRKQTYDSYVSRANDRGSNNGFDAALVYTPRASCDGDLEPAAAALTQQQVSVESNGCTHVHSSPAVSLAASAAAGRPRVRASAVGSLDEPQGDSCSQMNSPRVEPVVRSAASVVRFALQQEQLPG